MSAYRDLRESVYYRDDPMVKRLLGSKRLPDVATLSRMLQEADERSIENLRRLLRRLVVDRRGQLTLPRITLDFDGSVQSTGRRGEGAAVGFNKKKKGARSYDPLFCTIAQTGQVLDFLHRSGNVHDSRGAQAFIAECTGLIPEPNPLNNHSRAGGQGRVHPSRAPDSLLFHSSPRGMPWRAVRPWPAGPVAQRGP